MIQPKNAYGHQVSIYFLERIIVFYKEINLYKLWHFQHNSMDVTQASDRVILWSARRQRMLVLEGVRLENKLELWHANHWQGNGGGTNAY